MDDILIIGGGIAGVSAAARLAQTASVRLLEAEDALAYHASGRSAAMYLEDYGNPVVRALNIASRGRLDEAGVLSPRGMLLVAKASEAEAFHPEAADFGLDEIDVGEALALLPILSPDVVRFAGYRGDVFDLDTDLLLQSFRKEALAAGARIMTRHKVTEITRSGAGWHVATEEGTFKARVLVNAAGAWADGIAVMAGVTPKGLQPYRRSMARLPAPGGLDTSDWPFCDGVGEAWYAKPDAGKWIVSPSDEDPVAAQDAWADDMVLAEGLARYEAMMTEPVTRVETSWAGLRTFAPDRTLVIGRDPSESQFFWLAGQGGYGFQTATAAADLTATIFNEKAPDLPMDVVSALSPARFA